MNSLICLYRLQSYKNPLKDPESVVFHNDILIDSLVCTGFYLKDHKHFSAIARSYNLLFSNHI